MCLEVVKTTQKMPIDKFGRHLHQHPQSVRTDSTKLFLVENISELEYETLITILGQGTNSNGFFYLWGGLLEYECNFTSAIIDRIIIYPGNTLITINNTVYQNSDAVGLKLKKGDKLGFRSDKKGKSLNLFFEAVLKIPLIVKTESV